MVRSDRKRAVTSVDVAAAAGVSQATVARCFTTPEVVAPDTRLKIEAAADRLGYVPNAIARSLKSQRTNIVGAVVPAVGEYWQNVVTYFSRRLTARGRQLLLFSFLDQEEVNETLEAVMQYRLDGLILASATIAEAQLARMRQTGLSLVAFNHPDAAGIVPSVTVDNEAGASELARHLADLGCTRVLYLGGVAAASTDRARFRGAARTLASTGVRCNYMEAGAFTYEAGYRAAERVGSLDSLPDAIMVGSDEVAFGMLDGLRRYGLTAPGDVLVTGFDGLPQAGWAGYDLTTLVQPADRLAEHAVELAAGDTADPSDAQPPSVVVAGTLRRGLTTRKGDTEQGGPGSLPSHNGSTERRAGQ
ncbi:MAG: LacI family transcriptional regulator [Acidimicrobiaceae bacterium]|nr:LacI family DNA-binding transcriptional regulator [Acidimicrobiaceae bacterium]MXW98760.1 LacI family transcriptional regulator [Acidimicrobiaceae bacterium]MYE09561.1 LacI family transcriptional regulator [Acidimicrobiaceae bacterium]MYI36072.1 LacI family transcriptional regulator [Acidimicrobiaceae bacterium]